MIERLLVANRGEIARRIIATCKRLDIESVAVFSDADRNAAFVLDADLGIALGGNAPSESYLRIDAIIDAAMRSGADAIHPGYGFLSENADFARAVLDAGIIFVGPTPEVIAVMGSKLAAKEQMAAAGVPLLPSLDLTGLTDAEVHGAAVDIGYPILLKASAGGGGRGMRIVRAEDGLLAAARGAQREAVSAFGDGTIYAERYVAPSRHVEVQIMGDAAGSVIHLHERECSIQRRHQKIIEEAPSPTIDESLRTALHSAAVAAGKAIGYTNAGTVEFLVGPPGADGTVDFYFLEVNTRLQVEHPVTEAVLGLDLVEMQLHVAAGGAVPDQADIGAPIGCAIEARLYAEDPTADFRPSTGAIRLFEVPSTVRVDSAIDNSGEVTRFYDPMIAKVIAHAPTRQQAARRLSAALAASTIDGIATNRELLVRTLRHPEFLGGRGDSEFLERNDPTVMGSSLLDDTAKAVHAAAAALVLQFLNRAADPHAGSVASGFRNVSTAPQVIEFHVGDEAMSVRYLYRRGVLVSLSVNDVVFDDPTVYDLSATSVDFSVNHIRRRFRVEANPESVSVIGSVTTASFVRVPRFREAIDVVAAGSLVAVMPGVIVAVHVSVGDEVVKGDTLVVMEAMKMELAITALASGTVQSVPVSVGDAVGSGEVLIVLHDGNIAE